MPIRFRCGYCSRLLGIARRKAGTETTCPHCGYTVTVPEEEAVPERPPAGEFDDLDALINPQAATEEGSAPESSPALYPAPAASSTSSTAVATAARSAPPTPAAPYPYPIPSPAHAPASTSPSAPAASLDSRLFEAESGKIVLSVHKAAALAVVVVILLGLAFAGGFLLASYR